MKSKTSFCNGTVLRKNLTRFAPAWILYTLCLMLGMALMYVNDDNDFWFANNMGELIQYSSIINLIYAPLVAMLLFGDLYNSRMCNALHAMPLKRGCWFGTHVISGLLFSLIPTAVFCGLSVPLLADTCVVGGEWIALWTFLGMNLTYLCFFGIAVFSVFCAGNRFTMAAMYALLNGGAFVAWFLIDTIYTPMLYGVVTPTMLVENLTPVYHLTQAACVELESYRDLVERYQNDLLNMTANFWLLPKGWLTLAFWAAVGAAFMALGRLLYRSRKLECAGDAMAAKALEPVFLVCFSLCAAAFVVLFLQMFFGSSTIDQLQALFLICGLVVGWFAAKMIIERTVRVFRFKNWLGLFALAVVLAGSLAMTRFDVFGIGTWTPDAEDVKSASFGYSMYRGMSEELTDKEDIEAVIRLQELALEEKLEESGGYPVIDGVVQPRFITETMDGEELDALEYRYASVIYIYYNMKNGRTVEREYVIWCDGEEGAIANEYLSRWEVVSVASYYGELTHVEVVGEIGRKEDVYTCININGNPVPEEYCTAAELESLIAAIQADCEARTMTQKASFHTGQFRMVNELGDYETGRSFWIEFAGENARSGSFNVFPDSENTLNWLKERGLLAYEVIPRTGYNG